MSRSRWYVRRDREFAQWRWERRRIRDDEKTGYRRVRIRGRRRRRYELETLDAWFKRVHHQLRMTMQAKRVITTQTPPLP